MLDEIKTWQLILDCLERSVPAALLIVVKGKGSAPGKAGAKMAIAADGRLSGTIGGGSVERKLVDTTRDMLSNGESRCLLKKQIHKPDSDQWSGMICGGSQTTAIYPCSHQDLSHIKALVDALLEHQAGLFRLRWDGMVFKLHTGLNGSRHCFQQRSEQEWVYEENVIVRDTAYLIGGGHVSLALSRILATLDFYIVVIDSRAEINTLVENTYAHKKIITSFKTVGDYIPDGDHNYAIIMTPSHTTDELVLRQALPKNLRYLGMLGSKTKVATVMQRLQKTVPKEKLNRVRAPVGAGINSHTPAEIAVSIAAEMIEARS